MASLKMRVSLDSNSSFINNLRTLNALEPDTFSLIINGRKIKFPLFEAIAKSTKILSQDNTIRSLRIKRFRNKATQKKIISFLTSNEPIFKEKLEDDEIFDFAVFHALFGSKILYKPLLSYQRKHENDEINENNVLRRIDIKDITSFYWNKTDSIDKELEYISSNFNLFYNNINFIKWCKYNRNEERVKMISFLSLLI